MYPGNLGLQTLERTLTTVVSFQNLGRFMGVFAQSNQPQRLTQKHCKLEWYHRCHSMNCLVGKIRLMGGVFREFKLFQYVKGIVQSFWSGVVWGTMLFTETWLYTTCQHSSIHTHKLMAEAAMHKDCIPAAHLLLYNLGIHSGEVVGPSHPR